jgi:hypothetical protein
MSRIQRDTEGRCCEVSSDSADVLALLYRYAQATDEIDDELLADCLTKDAVLESEIVGGRTLPRIEGRDTYVRFICDGRRRQRESRRHFVTNAFVVTETEMTAEVSAYVMVASTVDGRFQPLASGSYRMSVVMDGGRWRIAHVFTHLDSELPGPLGWVD